MNISGISLDDIDSVENVTKEKVLTTQEEYQDTLVFNNAVREIFLNRFVQLFSGYDHFVIHPSQVHFKKIFLRKLTSYLNGDTIIR